MRKQLLCLLMLCSGFGKLQAQEVDLDKMLDEEMSKKNKNEVQYTEATFKTTRLINGHSIENTQAGILDFKISHRFGRLNQGSYDLFGLDNASMRMGLDYGITDRLMVGIGRSTFEKQYDGFIKYKLLRQSTGKRNMPISLSVMTAAMNKTIREPDPAPGVKAYASDKWFFAHQLIIARKFSEAFSLQLMPTMIHYNVVPLATNQNDLFSMGVGGRVKLTQRLSVNAEYYYQINRFSGMKNSLSFGFDIETGGHVFQLHVTNSTGMTERTFITETDGSWGNGDIHFGFNISRVFTIKRPKK